MAANKKQVSKGLKRNAESFDIPCCKRPLLDITTTPVPDETILETYFEDIYPVYSPERAETPVEFLIPSSESHYLDLNNTYLYLKLKVTDKDYATLSTDSATSPSNHLPRFFGTWIFSFTRQR